MKSIPFYSYYDLLSRYLARFWKKIIVLSVLILSRIGIMLYYPQIIKQYVDSVAFATMAQLRHIAFIYLFFVILQQFILISREYFSQTISWGATNALRNDLLRHTISLDMSFHNKYKSGDMIERIDGDVNALSNFFSQLTINMTANIILVLVINILMYLQFPLLGLAFSVFIIVSASIISKVRNFAVPQFKAHRNKSMELFGYIEERLSGTEDIRAIGAVPGIMKKYHDKERGKYRAFMKAILYSRAISATFNTLLGTAVALGFAIATPMFVSGQITLGEYYVIYFYTFLLVGPIFEILRQVQNLQEADASILRINELFAIRSKIDNNGTYKLAKDLDIEFKNVCFRYHEDKPVIQNLSFKLASGETLGLIGRTGSGKTTITRLLYRLYDIDEGQILLNGRSITDIELYHLRDSIGMVTQDVQLYHTSLRNNVTFFDDTIDDAHILEVIRNVGLSSWYDHLEDGLDTIIASDGSGVSAGEAQLLSVTRLFLKNPKLIILDEASSRLDPSTERKLNRAISDLTRDKTTIIIAHRLETLRDVDKILLIADGQLQEFGNRADLEMDKNSKYAQLIRTGIEEVLV